MKCWSFLHGGQTTRYYSKNRRYCTLGPNGELEPLSTWTQPHQSVIAKTNPTCVPPPFIWDPSRVFMEASRRWTLTALLPRWIVTVFVQKVTSRRGAATWRLLRSLQAAATLSKSSLPHSQNYRPVGFAVDYHTLTLYGQRGDCSAAIGCYYYVCWWPTFTTWGALKRGNVVLIRL